jgi:hypothetical protein
VVDDAPTAADSGAPGTLISPASVKDMRLLWSQKLDNPPRDAQLVRAADHR